jgi:hypothetical protein
VTNKLGKNKWDNIYHCLEKKQLKRKKLISLCLKSKTKSVKNNTLKKDVIFGIS